MAWKRLLLGAACVALGWGCGGASVDGTVAGRSLAIREAWVGPSPDGKSAIIALVDREGMCEALGTKSVLPELHALTLYTPTEAGTSRLGGGGGAHDLEAIYTSYDKACQPEALPGGSGSARSALKAQEGTVVLDEISLAPDGRARGRFELKMGPRGESVTGEFSARYCAALGQKLEARPACRFR